MYVCTYVCMYACMYACMYYPLTIFQYPPATAYDDSSHSFLSTLCPPAHILTYSFHRLPSVTLSVHLADLASLMTTSLQPHAHFSALSSPTLPSRPLPVKPTSSYPYPFPSTPFRAHFLFAHARSCEWPTSLPSSTKHRC